MLPGPATMKPFNISHRSIPAAAVTLALICIHLHDRPPLVGKSQKSKLSVVSVIPTHVWHINYYTVYQFDVHIHTYACGMYHTVYNQTMPTLFFCSGFLQNFPGTMLYPRA